MLIHSASQLLTIKGEPQRGRKLGQLAVVEDGAVVTAGERIAAVGKSSDLLQKYPNEERVDVKGRVVMPGLIDPHTHLVWAGDRAAEFEMRLEGKSYQEIHAAGGGILSTVSATRAASFQDLLDQAQLRAEVMFFHGTTTAEAKSGYGLDLKSELKQLEVLLRLNDAGPLEILPTFLGAHAVPPEYQGQPDVYVSFLCEQVLPEIHSWWLKKTDSRPLPFVDVFCEKGVFNLAQSRRILETARSLGFPLKIHADEFENLGGAGLAAELGAVSADHLVKISARDIQALAGSQTAAVALPCTPFGLAEQQYTPAQAILNAGGLLALASDLNPGTAWCGNMQFVIALACRSMRLTPAQAVAAATINAAAAIGMQDLLGTIESGKQADMLILSVSDYRHLAYRFGTNLVEAVIKKGRVFHQGQPC
jgi:imidazolonepropionase